MKTILGGLFLILSGAFSFSLWAGEDPRVRNLRDISGLQVIVETLTPDARQAGITEERVRNQVSAHFK